MSDHQSLAKSEEVKNETSEQLVNESAISSSGASYDFGPGVTALKSAQAAADDSPSLRKIAQLQALADATPSNELQRMVQLQAQADQKVTQTPNGIFQLQAKADARRQQTGETLQRQENKTGLPDPLKSGVESLSGISLDDVKVHRNSDKPAQLQAHAYAQGTDIHLGPGQEKHLPHEAWHVVQQKQGRVQPTTQLKGKVNINDDAGLEKEADVMGAKAVNNDVLKAQKQIQNQESNANIYQLVVKVNEQGEEYNSFGLEEFLESQAAIHEELFDLVKSEFEKGIQSLTEFFGAASSAIMQFFGLEEAEASAPIPESVEEGSERPEEPTLSPIEEDKMEAEYFDDFISIIDSLTANGAEQPNAAGYADTVSKAIDYAKSDGPSIKEQAQDAAGPENLDLNDPDGSAIFDPTSTEFAGVAGSAIGLLSAGKSLVDGSKSIAAAARGKATEEEQVAANYHLTNARNAAVQTAATQALYVISPQVAAALATYKAIKDTGDATAKCLAIQNLLDNLEVAQKDPQYKMPADKFKKQKIILTWLWYKQRRRAAKRGNDAVAAGAATAASMGEASGVSYAISLLSGFAGASWRGGRKLWKLKNPGKRMETARDIVNMYFSIDPKEKAFALMICKEFEIGEDVFKNKEIAFKSIAEAFRS